MLPAIRQSLFGELLDENRDLSFHGGCQHAPSPFSGDLGQWILNRFRLPERYDTGIVLHGVSLLLEVLAGLVSRHDTPPSQIASPNFGHSSIFSLQDRITESIVATLAITLTRAEQDRAMRKEVGNLQRLMSSEAAIFGKKRSGNCSRHQRMVKQAIKRARSVALLPYL